MFEPAKFIDSPSKIAIRGIKDDIPIISKNAPKTESIKMNINFVFSFLSNILKIFLKRDILFKC